MCIRDRTQVGDTDIPADKDLYDSWTGDAPVLDTGSNNDYSTLQYQAENHKYEVSYSVETVEGLKFYTAETVSYTHLDVYKRQRIIPRARAA